MMKCVFVLLVVASACSAKHHMTGKQECLTGARHKKMPTKMFGAPACQRYNQLSCCNTKTVEYIASSQQRVGNYSWSVCGPLSRNCNNFMRKMECFYQCEPSLAPWKHPTRKGGIKEVPICPMFCDNWYSACKDDMTCTKNWLGESDATKSVRSACPAGQKCRKFSEIYESGREMCNTMWGDSLKYYEGDSKKGHLEVDFEGPNPNKKAAMFKRRSNKWKIKNRKYKKNSA